MIEIKTEETPPTKAGTKPQHWPNKYFTKAINCSDPAKKMRNQIVDMVYVRFLKTVKDFYSKLPDSTERKVCERNRRVDRSCPESIWNFATPTFTMNLTCDPLSQYWINYDLNNCPFEREIIDLFSDCGLINRYMTRLDIRDYEKYFNNLVDTYPEQTYTLKNIQP